MSLLFPVILYSGSTEQKMIATSSGGHFSPLPTFFHRVQQVGMGGLMIRHVSLEDAGSYTIEVNAQTTCPCSATLLFMFLVIGIRLRHGWYGVGYCLVFDVTLHVAGNWDKVKT